MSYRKEFFDFDPSTMPTVPEGFVDESWHNDACPKFVDDGRGLLLWIDHVDPAQRELQGHRFSLCRLADDVLVASSDDWQAILSAIVELDVAGLR